MIAPVIVAETLSGSVDDHTRLLTKFLNIIFILADKPVSTRESRPINLAALSSQEKAMEIVL